MGTVSASGGYAANKQMDVQLPKQLLLDVLYWLYITNFEERGMAVHLRDLSEMLAYADVCALQVICIWTDSSFKTD